jgi:hypothetical protein
VCHHAPRAIQWPDTAPRPQATIYDIWYMCCMWRELQLQLQVSSQQVGLGVWRSWRLGGWPVGVGAQRAHALFHRGMCIRQRHRGMWYR